MHLSSVLERVCLCRNTYCGPRRVLRSRNMYAGSCDVDPTADAQLHTEDAVTQSLGRAHRAIKLPHTMFAHQIDPEHGLVQAHPDLLDVRACAHSAVLCPRNATVDDFNARALRKKAALDGYPIQRLSGKTSLKSVAGAPLFEDEPVSEEFLNLCDKTGGYPT